MQQIKRNFLLVASLVCCGAAQADSWTGRDKTLHAIGGAAIGVAVTATTGVSKYGCVAATSVGVAKEIYDGRRFSVKDAIVTAAAGCIASKTTELIILPNRVIWSRSF